jgi:hypothetical protein
MKTTDNNQYTLSQIKRYLDQIHINENNTLQIREVDIKINTDSKFN